ncbi:hypothetical protein PILCRDRAFT_826531 [Piloderma croceum F 1598]|uniref:Uncharacterized protein n=1 Tax=Piloderma croceum (strain F 1598) TaxID=765440 RepID=A0A0C3BFS3_PILCF|nr:hypothetical protein PILCRDRAFT_826531 [Piloderma croceum F 1598]
MSSTPVEECNLCGASTTSCGFLDPEMITPKWKHKFKYICQTVRRSLWMLESARAAT